jgi:hypothetical protein
MTDDLKTGNAQSVDQMDKLQISVAFLLEQNAMLEKRNKELETALDVIASNNGLALSWMSTAPMPLERYKDNCYEMMNIARAALGEKTDG